MNTQKRYRGQFSDQTAPSIWSISDLIRDYERTSSGHFFSKDTMKFFNSKVIEFFRSYGDVAYFITSEKNSFTSDSKRLYTVRKAERVIDQGSFYGYKYVIDTAGEFQQFKTSAAAKKALEKMIESIEE